jgi:hypothetical protein
MSRPFARQLGLVGVLALMAMIQPLPPTLASSAGREFSRCVQACNEGRRACDERCKTECAELFPDSKTQRDACIAACKTVCSVESEDCKQVCQSIKNGHPEEP